MDRLDFYPSMQPTDTMLLSMERNKMIALGYLAQGVLGTTTIADGLSCAPTSPASLAIQIGPGQIFQQEPVDSVAYGSLGIDSVDQIIKQGIILGVTPLTLTPPVGSGQAINYLIQAEILEQDTNNVVLSYFNSANPQIPLTGPGGSGAAQPTLRQCTVNLVAKAGAAATAGSQVTPSPDAGYVGLWVVTVANGATALTSGQISQYSGAPFISVKLPAVPNWVQGGTWAWGTDTGTANAIAVTLNPVPANIAPGFELWFLKNVLSTGAVVIAVNGGSNVAVLNEDGSALSSSVTMAHNVLIGLKFDGTSYRWINGSASTAVGSLSASSGEGVNVNGSGVVSLTFPSLSVEATVANTDLWAFYSQADTHHRVMSWAQLVANLNADLTFPSVTLPVANYTTNGIAREATNAECIAGATSGSNPAFVPPAGLGAALAAEAAANASTLQVGATLSTAYSVMSSSTPSTPGAGTNGTSSGGAVSLGGVSIRGGSFMPNGQVWTVVSSLVSQISNSGNNLGQYPWLISVNAIRTS